MSKWLRVVSVSLFGLLVAAVLAVGAHTALAQPATADCQDDGWIWLGSCVSTAHCQEKCDNVHGIGNSVGSCTGGCCRCYF